MGCGCRKRPGGEARVTGASDLTLGKYQVWRNGTYTGRSFASLAHAQTYASRIGGEIRASS